MIAARPSGMSQIRKSGDSVPFFGTKKPKRMRAIFLQSHNPSAVHEAMSPMQTALE